MDAKKQFYFALWGALIQVPVVDSMLTCTGSQAGPSYESLQDVFNRRSLRPTLNYHRPTSANISFTIYAILGVNEKTQILTTFLWLRLVRHMSFFSIPMAEETSYMNYSKLMGMNEEQLEREICPPPFSPLSIDEDKSQRTPYVYVNHTGTIRYDRMLRVVSSCNLGIFNFPFDVQNCSLTFGSYMHTVRDVRLGLALTIEQISENSKEFLETSGEWELVRIEGYPDILKFGIDEWDIVTFWVIVKRRPLLYVVNLLIPSAFLMVIDIMSFYLPPHSVDRASFKMTLLLGYTVFLLIMNDLLPSTTNGTPLIGIYFSVCLALLVLSLLETVIITHVLHRGAVHGTRIPNWVKTLLVEFIARLVCYKAPPQANEKTATSMCVQVKQNNLDSEEKLKVPQAPSPPHPDCMHSRQQLEHISQDLLSIRGFLERHQQEREKESEWVRIGYILDSLLYRLYLSFVAIYAVVIISLWCVWYNL
ncbi:5-hydroxytryptamine receptor 3A-like [Lissotriton helveticus]